MLSILRAPRIAGSLFDSSNSNTKRPTRALFRDPFAPAHLVVDQTFSSNGNSSASVVACSLSKTELACFVNFFLQSESRLSSICNSPQIRAELPGSCRTCKTARALH